MNLGLSDSENFTIMIVEMVIITIMNTITIVNWLIHQFINTKIQHGFLNNHQLSLIKVAFLSFQKVFVGKTCMHSIQIHIKLLFR